jgi:simple sugar transport system permease protein
MTSQALPLAQPKASLWSRLGNARRYIMITTVILALMLIIVLVGRQENTVADIVASFIATTITFATPLTLGALSGIYCERSGVVNIAIEGMMLGACFFGFIGAGWFKSLGVPDQPALWLGIGVAMLTGFLLAALHAVLSIRFKVNQIISGTVINILAVGLTGYLNRQLFFQAGSAQLQSAGTLSRMTIPLLSDLPLIGGIFNQPPITYLALILVIVTQFVLFRTVWGLRTRAVGEHPRAADTVGINVFKMRYINVLIGGVIAGLGGAFFTLQSVGAFEPGMTAGRGFIALAAMIFGNWSPVGAFAAALLFASAQAFQINLQFYSALVPPELDFLKKSQIVGMLPYLLTMFALTGIVGRTTPPAEDGIPYEKGE